MGVDFEHEQDRAGCVWLFLRVAGCISILYITMFIAIFLIALVGILFF